VSLFSKFIKNWLQPFLYLGRNRLSLIGGAITSASALVLIGFWVIDIFGHGGTSNPYVGIILDLCLPALFLFGLLLIPIGIIIRRRELLAAGQLPSIYPKIDFGDPLFRHALDFVVVATFINFVIVGIASYRGVAYMDKPTFCGTSCHVMEPEWNAYHVSPHATVACTECHVAPGVTGYVHAKVNGTKQLLEVMLHRYPTPIMAEGRIPAAAVTCMNCHDPAAAIGDKLVVKTSFGDDEKNTMTHTMLLMHVGGSDEFGRLSGIHGAHLGHIEFISSDASRQTITWVAKTNGDGSRTEYLSSDATQPVTGEKHTMDCIDCHNRAAHSFDTPEEALNKAMAHGDPSPTLPFVHKEGLALLNASYTSQTDAEAKITTQLEDFYRSQYPAVWSQQQAQVEQTAKVLATLYSENVFPYMNVTWGTHPNNIGHNMVTSTPYPGCFRCHDGSHTTKDGSKTITQDCTACHNVLATDEANPKLLSDLGIQQ
jgi:nitrate/TMAO reductase-like tetraheme cytochrome c subunit